MRGSTNSETTLDPSLDCLSVVRLGCVQLGAACEIDAKQLEQRVYLSCVAGNLPSFLLLSFIKQVPTFLLVHPLSHVVRQSALSLFPNNALETSAAAYEFVLLDGGPALSIGCCSRRHIPHLTNNG